MAIGFSSDSTNGGADDGSLTVAQIRAPSTPFSSDTDPFNDFQFSGRNDVVTVKDVEGIVEAVKSSFAKFIEVQRSYIDNQTVSKSSSSETSETKNSSSAEPNQNLPQPSNSVAKNDEKNNENSSSANDLTEAAVSDIIEALSEKNNLLNTEIQDTLSDVKNGITSKFDSINNEISEKLINSSQENKKDEDQNNSPSSTDANYSTGISTNDIFMSFVEFMTGSNKRLENKVESLQENINLITNNQKNTENLSSTTNNKATTITSQIPVSTNIDAFDITSLENKGISGNDDENEKELQDVQKNDSLVSKIDNYFENLFNDIENMFSSNETINEEQYESQSTSLTSNSSIADIVNENNKLIKILKTDIDEISKSINGTTNDGIAKSLVEMMVQNSMIQMIASNTIEGMSSMMTKKIEERFGEAIHKINDISKNSQSSKIATDKNTSVSENPIDLSNTDQDIQTVYRENIENETSEISLSDKIAIDKNTSVSENPIDLSNTDQDIQTVYRKNIETTKTEISNIIKNDNSDVSNNKPLSNQETSSIEKDDETKRNGLFGFIEDTFNSFVSLFNTESTKRTETVKNENNVNSSIITEHDSENITSQPVIAAPSIERDSQDNTQIQIVKSDEVEEENNDNNDSLILDKEESINRAIARMHLNDENNLKVLDEISNMEYILDHFENQLEMIREQDKNVEGFKQLGDVTKEDLFKIYMSGRDERIASYASNMTQSTLEDEDKSNNHETDFGNNEQINKNDSNDETESNSYGLEKSIKENREYAGQRFDIIENMLKSKGESAPPQMIYMNSAETSFEVNRIG